MRWGASCGACKLLVHRWQSFDIIGFVFWLACISSLLKFLVILFSIYPIRLGNPFGRSLRGTFRSHVMMSSPTPSPRRNHLKVTRSASNLRVPAVTSTTGSPLAHNPEVLASSSSSMYNVDMNDRILVLEPEADVDTVIEQQSAIGQMGATAGDEESRENLRAKLRSTLSRKQSLPGTFLARMRPRSRLAISLLLGGVG